MNRQRNSLSYLEKTHPAQAVEEKARDEGKKKQGKSRRGREGGRGQERCRVS